MRCIYAIYVGTYRRRSNCITLNGTPRLPQGRRLFFTTRLYSILMVLRARFHSSETRVVNTNIKKYNIYRIYYFICFIRQMFNVFLIFK